MTSRWVKPAKGVYAPRTLVSVAVRGRPWREGERGRPGDEVWDSAAVCWAYYRSGRWYNEGRAEPQSGAELLDLVHSLAIPRSNTAVVCPVAQYALALSGAFVRWWEEGWEWKQRRGSVPEGTTPATPHRHSAPVVPPSRPRVGSNADGASGPGIVSTCILRGNPDIVRYSLADCQYTWVSGHNWFPSTEEGLAETMGFHWSNPGEPWRGKKPPLRSPADRAALWLQSCKRLADWWRSIEGGPWGWTIGSLAMSYFRKRLEGKSVLAHQVEPAREIEERGLYGGRAQTWCLAPIGDKRVKGDGGEAPPPPSQYPRLKGFVEHWDIQSMYPTILATRPFPTRIWFVHHRSSVARVASDLKKLAVVADVLVDTDTADYPARDGATVVWPVGSFRTVLCGPELQHAIDRGRVKHVYRSVSYTMGRPFAVAARSLIKLRWDANATKDVAWEQLVKSLSVAFGGRLAMIKHDWCATRKTGPIVSWGEWQEPDPATGRDTVYRTAAGLVWSKQPHKHKGRPLASCFCYLTAYGRALMRDILATIPPDQVVSIDTDGIWVLNPTPAQRLRAKKVASDAGFNLRDEKRTYHGQWYGPRHYWTTNGWVLSGYHEPRRMGRALTFRDTQTKIPAATFQEGPPKRVHVTTRTTRLETLSENETITPEGWVVPRRLAVQYHHTPLSDPPVPSTASPGPQ